MLVTRLFQTKIEIWVLFGAILFKRPSGTETSLQKKKLCRTPKVHGSPKVKWKIRRRGQTSSKSLDITNSIAFIWQVTVRICTKFLNICSFSIFCNFLSNWNIQINSLEAKHFAFLAFQCLEEIAVHSNYLIFLK